MEVQPTGKAKGAAARAAKLSSARRKEISQNAVAARRARASLPKIIKKGDDLNLAGIMIPCAVIEGPSGEPLRVLSENGITNAILGSRSGASKRLKKKAEDSGAALPLFLAPSQLKPFIDNNIESGPFKVIQYVDGDRVVRAFNAEVLPAVCEIWLKAREKGALQAQQLPKAQQAEMLTRGLARIGIVALVDEATGFQRDREKDALAKILEAFVAKELQPYLRTFPPDYYEQLFRLYGLTYPPAGNKSWRPAFFGHITNDVVYSRLAPDLLPELKKAATKAERKSKLHQWLTTDIGHPRLREHLASIVSVLKLSRTPEDFKANVNIAHPRYGDTAELDFGNPTP
jgi:hypothetical protein